MAHFKGNMGHDAPSDVGWEVGQFGIKQRNSRGKLIYAFIILITNTLSLIISFIQKTLRAVIDCMQKSFKCFETNQDEWRAVNGDGLKL